MPSGRLRRLFPISIAQWGGEAGIREKEWLGKTWVTFKQKFFIDPTNKRDEAKLGLQAITLALIYLDFCYLAWGLEYDIFACEEWAEELGIDKKSLIKLAREKGDKLTMKDFTGDNTLFADTLFKMANQLREEVFDLICPNTDDCACIIEDLSSINDSSEYPMILEKVYPWFSEKCYRLL